MIKLSDGGVYLLNGTEVVEEKNAPASLNKAEAQKGTISWSILNAHNTSGDMSRLKLKFDALTSHDITFVGIVQTAKASGMTYFPIPYVLT
ncbi:hydratase, partial [Klebsiella quasipneumoniae]